MKYFVGIDDTDSGISIGTGALARELDLFLRRHLGATSLGITRHQLLVHPDIPYTSHNSSACVELEIEAPIDDVVGHARRLIEFLAHDGADPGLCVVDARTLPDGYYSLGRRATCEIVPKQEAVQCAAASAIPLLELGGTGLGVIGALSACALRMSGEDGRFISMEGIRDIKGAWTAGEIMAAAGISRVVDDHGLELGADCVVETRGWVRPSLVGGKPVLHVVRDTSGWLIVNRKKEEE